MASLPTMIVALVLCFLSAAQRINRLLSSRAKRSRSHAVPLTIRCTWVVMTCCTRILTLYEYANIAIIFMTAIFSCLVSNKLLTEVPSEYIWEQSSTALSAHPPPSVLPFHSPPGFPLNSPVLPHLSPAHPFHSIASNPLSAVTGCPLSTLTGTLFSLLILLPWTSSDLPP